jgi:chromosome segregation ATPase
MPRVFSATKSSAGKKISCEKCSAKIEPKNKYYFYFKRFSKRARGVKCIRCSSHYPKQSELTSSETLATVYGVQESLQAAIRSASDGSGIISALEDAHGEIDGLVDTLDDKISNVENAFPNGTPVLDQLNEYKDNAEAYRDSIEQTKDEVETLWNDFEAEEEPDEVDDYDPEGDEPEEEHAARQEERQAWENRRDEVMSDIESLIDNIECSF